MEATIRAGTTLPEILVALAVAAIIAAIAVPRASAALDRLGARGATNDAVALLALAREAAVARAEHVALRLDSSSATIVVHTAADTLAERRLGAAHGVTLSSTRDSVAFAPSGLGFGAANTRIVISRGAAAETVVVARLGRVRRR